MQRIRRSYLFALLAAIVLTLALYSYVYIYYETLGVQSFAKILQPQPQTSAAINPIVPLHVTNTNKTILLWTPFFSQKGYIESISDYNCDVSNCIFTTDRSQLNQSHAILFHLRDTDTRDLPQFRSNEQRWVLLHHESPPHTPKMVLKDLSGLINWTITYRLDSDMRLSPPMKRKSSINLNIVQPNYSENKTRVVAWFVSNCRTPSHREDFVVELKKTVTVDVYGDCGDKHCVPKMSTKCYNDVAKDYRFYLSFENSLCKDYITEKFYAIVHQNIVPVVFGGANYSLHSPPGSFIDALAFDSPRSLGQHLIRLAKSPADYNRHFDWRKEYEFKYNSYVCQLCKKLNDPSEERKVWPDLVKWWFEEADCHQWQPRDPFL